MARWTGDPFNHSSRRWYSIESDDYNPNQSGWKIRKDITMKKLEYYRWGDDPTDYNHYGQIVYDCDGKKIESITVRGVDSSSVEHDELILATQMLNEMTDVASRLTKG
jgi:hypothetical protein